MAKDKGFEYLDDTPIEVPVRLRRKDSFSEMVQHVAHELSRRAAEQGGETLEESMDFGEDDDADLPLSPSELRYMKEEELLTEALEAAKLRTEQHRAAQIHKEMNRGKRAAEGKGKGSASDEGGNAVRESGSVNVVQEPKAKSG